MTAISPADFGWFGNKSGPAVAFDDAGHGVVADEGWPYASIFLGGSRFSQWLSICHGPNEAQPTVAVGVMSSGVGLATWVEEPSGTENTPTWAGRIRLDRSEPERIRSTNTSRTPERDLGAFRYDGAGAPPCAPGSHSASGMGGS